jgi:hypothetical protein
MSKPIWSDLEQHQAQDEEQGVHRVAREVQALGLDDRAVHEGHAQAHDAQEPEGVGQGLVGAVVPGSGTGPRLRLPVNTSNLRRPSMMKFIVSTPRTTKAPKMKMCRMPLYQ